VENLTVKQLQDWCRASGEHVQFTPGGMIMMGGNGEPFTAKHNLETLTECVLGGQSEPSQFSSDVGDEQHHVSRMDVIGQNGNDGLHYPATSVVPGYECLADVLERALNQASRGKGKERHAQDLPFSEQPMQQLIQLYGTGFAGGQAAKKAQESMRLPRDRAVAELLGGIVYLAGAIIHLEQQGAAHGG
jgi:hypothetical protein